MKALAKWERFIERTDSCWIWKGATKSGYGIVGVGGRSNPRHLKAHRLAILGFEDYDNPGFVCHKCNNPLCVNPAHLYLGNGKTNFDDMVASGGPSKAFLKYKGNAESLIGHHKKGEDASHSKLTWKAVREIRQAVANGSRYKPLAEKYGLHYETIANVARGKRWIENEK